MLRFQKILVLFDSEERDWTALKLALRLAGDSGGNLTIAHVIPQLPQDIPYDLGGMEELKRTLEKAAETTLENAIGNLPDSDVPLDIRVLWGHTGMEVSRVVVQQGHDLVMKATSSKGRFSGQLLGSVDMRLLRKCPCPVWLVKPGAHEDLKSVLAAVDPTSTEGADLELNQSILDLGLSLAQAEDADLHVLHAWSAWGGSLLRSRMRSAEFTGYVGQMRSRAGKALTEFLRPYDEAIPLLNRHLLEGQPEEVIPEFVRDREIDVVVMGTVVRTGVPGFLIGNTAEMILREVDCSVLAVKPRGFVTPVEVETSS
jgi:nucleotide-binding universal stress UspA family protein